MTDDRVSKPARDPALIGNIASWLLIIPSVILGILVVEMLCRVFLPASTIQSSEVPMRRVVFLDGSDTIFHNQGDIFTYVPHSEVRNMTGFFSGNDFKIEYDYHFRTNNFGLVQDADVVPERRSVLLLGDSFTEGLGTEPWFRLVSPEVARRGWQAINGGLLGTGFEQWRSLERYLVARKVQIQKVVVLFISDDYSRPVRIFNPVELRCLTDLTLCHLAEALIYRLPPRDELPSWIAKIRTARAPMTQKSWLAERVAALLPASYHVYQYLSNAGEHFRRAGVILRSVVRSVGAEQQSQAVIAELIKVYGRANVVFIHLPQKDEIARGGPTKLGLRARQTIQNAGGKLVDGFKLCRLTAADYYANDDHPNGTGYGKIAACANSVIDELMAEAP